MTRPFQHRAGSWPRCMRSTMVTWAALVLATALATAGGCTRAPRPILVLVSIDGWRWDYLDRFQPPAMMQLAREGVTAEGLVPVFPSKTFPNHYTIVTGLYPAHHGIVSNSMVDPALPGRFTLGNRDVQQDSRWWLGVPLWVTAERQSQIAATMFWPGSDVEIANDRPAYWRAFDNQLPNEARVDQLLAWLKEPEERQPTFLTLYFSEVDTAGHDFGPDAEETRQSALNVDAAIARLMRGLDELHLTHRANIVLTSDHGMSALSRDREIVLDDYLDLSTVEMIDSAPIVGLVPKAGVLSDTIYWALKGKHPALAVYKKDNLPDEFRLRGHPRIPDVIGIADDGWHPTTRARLKANDDRNDHPAGDHGYDPRHRSMHGLFIASGPQFKSGVVVPPFENVHVYELLCRVLGVTPAPNDGNPAVIANVFR